MHEPDYVNYSEDFSASDQIDAEEWIAAYLFENYREGVSESNAQGAGQDILQEMIQRFRPDLTEEGQSSHEVTVTPNPRSGDGSLTLSFDTEDEAEGYRYGFADWAEWHGESHPEID